MLKPEQRPIIILGAARSGTKMLRAAIGSHPNIVAIPYDINFVWKYGNYGVKHDELDPQDVTPKTKAFIHKFFGKFQKAGDASRVLEKTISNTVRVEFVKKIFPSCHFIHLIRDGRDVSLSSMYQWQAPLDTKKIIDKLRYMPIKALPNYATDYALSYLSPYVTGRKRVSTWGVTLKDLQDLLERFSLLEVCGIQWSRCVEHTAAALQTIPSENKIEIRYEDLVQSPLVELKKIFQFLEMDMTEEVVRHAQENIKVDYMNKWTQDLSQNEYSRLLNHISDTLKASGYIKKEVVGLMK